MISISVIELPLLSTAGDEYYIAYSVCDPLHASAALDNHARFVHHLSNRSDIGWGAHTALANRKFYSYILRRCGEISTRGSDLAAPLSERPRHVLLS